MEKNKLSDKMAKKAFESAKIQASWNVHYNAFGPIMAPAFKDDYQTKIHLTAALNHISRQETQKGMDGLKKIESACKTDADRAAYTFFVGLCYEMAGDKEKMSDYYQQAGKFGHRFYLPYLKIAKKAYADGQYELADKNFRAALECLDGSNSDSMSEMIRASIHANYASCLIMMYQFDQAEEQLGKSEKMKPGKPEQSAIGAILYAAKGDKERLAECMAQIEQKAPFMLASVTAAVQDILDGKNPHFAKRE